MMHPIVPVAGGKGSETWIDIRPHYKHPHQAPPQPEARPPAPPAPPQDRELTSKDVQAIANANGYNVRNCTQYKRLMGSLKDNNTIKYSELQTEMRSWKKKDIDTKSRASSTPRTAAPQVIAKAKGKDSARAIRKLTEVADGKLRIVSDPPVVVPMREMIAQKKGDEVAERFDEQTIERLMNAVFTEYRTTLETTHTRRACPACDPSTSCKGTSNQGGIHHMAQTGTTSRAVPRIL